MGPCLSCLGLGASNADAAGAEDEPTETSRLLREEERAAEYGASAGAAIDPDLMPIQDLDLDDEDEPPEQVQAYLAKTWRETSDKLIDITHVANPTDADGLSKGSEDYQRFFNDTFHTARRPDSGGDRPTIHKDTFLPPGEQSEQDWLRGIILRDPEDKSWDCNRVRRIGKPLIMSFDEAVARDESEASGPMRGAGDSKTSLHALTSG